MAAPHFSDEDYTELSRLFSCGDISACPMVELEQFAVMLSRPEAFTHFSTHGFPQVCETVRTLLIVRMSEAQNVQAKKESRLALIIACVALIAGIVQTAFSAAQYFSNAPIQVQANTPLPVRAALPIPVYAAPPGSDQQKSVATTPALQK